MQKKKSAGAPQAPTSIKKEAVFRLIRKTACQSFFIKKGVNLLLLLYHLLMTNMLQPD
jgi:hypothetical protein